MLAVGLCGVLAFFLMRAPARKVNQPPVVEPVSQEPAVTAMPLPMPISTTQQAEAEPSDTATNVIAASVEQKVPPVFGVPTGITYKPITLINRREELFSVLSAVSNAVLSVDRILKSRSYTVHEFSRTKWLVAEDKAQSTVWTIFPYKTNAVVGSVEAVVYQDKALTQKDQTRSFRMSFYPEVGTLRDFSWGDKHEVLLILTNGTSDYGRNLGGKMGLVMRWDKQGNLVSSNVYNWATRGQPIGQHPKALPSRPPWPTSSVEAATESWRQTNGRPSQPSARPN